MAKVLDFPANRIEKGVHAYYPEMGERKVNAQMEARLSHYGNHYFLDTPVELKGRGITYLKTYAANDFIPPNNKVGWHSYKVTKLAFDKLTQQYSSSMERLLD